MRLTFFGTRGYVEASSPSHLGHSAFAIDEDGFRLLCDFGENRRGMLSEIRPDAIVVSHAHPDHSWGLAEGTTVPVCASPTTHEILAHLPLGRRIRLGPGKARRLGPFRVTLHPVVHSIRCPCTAISIAGKNGHLLYSSDVVSFPSPESAFPGVDLYVGDGSTLTQSLVRRHASGTLLGHTTIRAQLGWLQRFGVKRAIFSHFGTGPIRMGDAELRERLGTLVQEKAPGCAVSAAADRAAFVL